MLAIESGIGDIRLPLEASCADDCDDEDVSVGKMCVVLEGSSLDVGTG